MQSGSFPSGCTGKLPSFGDFVKYNASSRESLALDQWLQQGLYHAQTKLGHGWGKIFLASPAYDFLFWPENCERFLIGHIQPSHDRSNREYPFAVMLLVDRLRFGEGRIASAPFLFADFLAGARRLARRATEGLDMREIAEATQALSVPLPLAGASVAERHVQFLQETTLHDFGAGLFGDAGNPMQEAVFRHLIEILAPMQRYGVQRLKYGLRFPLSTNGTAVADEASYWLQLSAKIAGSSQFGPVAFWTAAENAGPRRMLLFFRQPSPKVLLQLLMPEEEEDSVYILEKQGAGSGEAPGATVLSKRQEALLHNPSSTLKMVLEGLP